MFKLRLPVLLSALVLVGCAKEKEYDTVYKDIDIQRKSAIKTHKTVKGKDGKEIKVPVKYMYVPMSLGTPRKVRSAFPFFQGDEKLVRLEWSESGLEVLEMEKDERFSDNELNDSPVLSIPVDHVSYRCKEDQFGDCTNAEEENNELEWNEKNKFVPKFEDIKVTELQSIDVYGIRDDSCSTVKDTQVKDYEISDGVLNIEIEKTYRLKNSFWCIIGNWINQDLSSNSYKVRYFFSLVELDKLASPDYQPIDYPIPDHDQFGFFKNKISRLTDDFDGQRKEERYLVNRFNPNQKNGELVYYLSKNFNKPEHKILLDASYKAVEIMNRGLNSIGNPFKIVLKQQADDAKEISPGDLRYNALVLLDDPLANGLLGYGPSVSNPETGEILKAHVNMYGGVLKAISRRTYDAAVDESVRQYEATKQPIINQEMQVAASAFSALPAPLAQELATFIEPVTEAPAEEEAAPTEETTAPVENAAVNNPAVAAALQNYSVEKLNKQLEFRLKSNTSNNRRQLIHMLESDNSGLDEFEKHMFDIEKEEFKLGKIHVHKPEFFPIGGTGKVVFPELFKIEGILNKDGKTLKRWNKLTKTQKNKAVNIIIEKSWISTLIHEFGHNLGLRHNFQGSWDRHNFLTDEDLATMGMAGKKRPAYSSIMDYSISEFNQLASFGNYDLAALRFAYKREIEVMDAAEAENMDQCRGAVRVNPNVDFVCKPKVQIVKIDQPLMEVDKELGLDKKERKPYDFCTDENAGLSSTCNRFDEGTSLLEIAKFRAQRYEDVYKYRNFRDGRLDFTAYDIPRYLFWRRYELSQIRDIVEEYEFFKTIFDAQNPQIMMAGCSDEQVKTIPVCGMINDRIKAVEVVGDMLINILKTPDHICAAVKSETPNVVVAYKKLAEIYDEIKFNVDKVPESCFDDVVKAALKEEGLEPVGETGKYLNGFKDTNPNFKYATDRAVLGTWPDKVMAMRALFNRHWKNRTTDRAHYALIDHPAIRAKAQNVLAHYLLGEPLESPLPFRMENGATFSIPYAIGNDYKVEQVEDIFSWVRRGLGMSGAGGSSSLAELIFRQSSRSTWYGEEYAEAAYTASNMVSIRKARTVDAIDRENDDFTFVAVDDVQYFANSDNFFAKFMLDAIRYTRELSTIDKEVLAKVLKQRTNPEPPAELEDDQATFFKQPGGLHEQLLTLAAQGAQVPEAAFIQALGEVDGPKVFRVYNQGLEVMQAIVALKQAIMTNPAEDATELEKKVFKYPVGILSRFMAGALSPEVIDFYKKQLKKMPGHTGRANI